MSESQEDLPDTDEARSLFEHARNEMRAANLSSAAKLLAESAQLTPHYKTLLLLGECLFHLGRVKDAIVPLAAATTLNRQGIAPTLLAEALLKMGDPTKAQEMIDLALQRQSHYKRAQILKPTIDAAVAERYRSMGYDVNG